MYGAGLFMFYGVFFLEIASYEAYYLGIFQGLDAIIGTFGNLIVGRIEKYTHIYILCRVGMILSVLSTIILLSSSTMWTLFICISLMSMSQSCFWPSALIGVTKLGGDKYATFLSIFNVMWSGGKSFGYLVAGLGFGFVGKNVPLFIAVGAFTTIFVLFPVPLTRACVGEDEDLEMDSSVDPPEILDTITIIKIEGLFDDGSSQKKDELLIHLILSYVSNFVSISAFIILGNQFPQYSINNEIALTEDGSPELFFGVFMCTIFSCQTTLFGVFSVLKCWEFKRILLYVSMVCMAGSLIAISFINNAMILLAIAVVLGISGGFIMQSSVVYSLSMESDERSKYAGIHESIVCLGCLILPLSTGFVVTATDNGQVSFWICAAVGIIGPVVCEIIYRVFEFQKRKQCQTPYV
jgi:MFS family permease